MIIMPINTWSSYKTTVITNKSLLLQYTESSSGYEIYAVEANTFVWNIFIPKDGGSDVTDFETNYKASANKPLASPVTVQSAPPFGAKTIVVNGVTKSLFARFTGLQYTVNSGNNTLTYTATYNWAKIIGIEAINCDELDTVDLKIYDDANGTYSGHANLLLNQFSYTLNMPKDYYIKMAQFDADLYVGMVIKLTYNSVAVLPKTVGINLLMNEVK